MIALWPSTNGSIPGRVRGFSPGASSLTGLDAWTIASTNFSHLFLPISPLFLRSDVSHQISKIGQLRETSDLKKNGAKTLSDLKKKRKKPCSILQKLKSELKMRRRPISKKVESGGRKGKRTDYISWKLWSDHCGARRLRG